MVRAAFSLMLTTPLAYLLTDSMDSNRKVGKNCDGHTHITSMGKAPELCTLCDYYLHLYFYTLTYILP